MTLLSDTGEVAPEEASKTVTVELQVTQKDRSLVALMAALRAEYPRNTWARVIAYGLDRMSEELPTTIDPSVLDLLRDVISPSEAPAAPEVRGEIE